MELEVKNGSFSYRSGTPVLLDVNFAIASNEILTILGANGAGKTTLLKCLLGFERWSSGQTLIDGHDLREISAKDLWSRIGYVPQAKAPTFSYTVLDLVLMGRSVHLGDFAAPKRHDYDLASAALERVGIAHLSERLCHEISGGQYQLALIARALVGEPRLLVLDEPESNLDYKNQLQVLELLTDLSVKDGVGSVINTHYPAHALEIGDKALVMIPQAAPVFGETSETVTEENLSKSFGVGVTIVETPVPARPGFKSVVAHR